MGRGRNMRIRGRWLALVGVAVALGSGAVVAYADSINGDGDVLTPNNNISYTDSASFTQHCVTRGTPLVGAVTVKFNGTKHYDPGATLTFTATPDAAGTAAGITTTGGTATVPTPWDTTGETFTGPISTTVPATVPNGTYVVTVAATGPAHDGKGNPITLETDDTYNVSVSCNAVAPVIAWTADPSSANEGDQETYSFSITDPDSTSWSFGAGYPSCGSAGTLSGAPSIDSSAKTGTFTCSFPNGPATSTVGVAVSDGGSASNVLTQSVTVANVAPTVSFTSAPPTAFEGETKTFGFAVSDPGTTDTYAAAAGFPSCGTGGTYVSGSLSLTGNHGSQTGTFQCSFPSPATTTVSIAFTDSSGQTGNTATTVVTVQDAPLTAGALTITNGVESLTASQLTFGFTDANPAGAATDYTATINWGDSTTSSGTITAAAGGGFTVHASHGYVEEGNYTVTVTVADVGGATTSAGGVAVVADAPLTAGTITVGDGVAGVTPAALAFGFTDANPAGTVSDFTATIDWGDSTTSAGAVAASGTGFTVQGSHTYTHSGSFTVTVTVADVGGSTTTATASTTITAAPLTAGTLTISDGVEGATASQLAFGFTDANPAGVAADYNAVITWGDSTTSPGTIVSAPGGGFTVQASHTYADEGSYPVTVAVTSTGGSTTGASGHATVTDAPLTAGTLTVGPGVAGVTPAPLTFAFTDANTAAPASDFTATISWGDSSTSAGTVAASGTGFTVQGNHLYTHSGSYTVTVTVTDVGGSTVTATGAAVVASSPLTAGALTITAGVEGATTSQLSFGFTDANPATVAADYTATIDWGDTTTSAGTITSAPGGGFTVHGTHQYADEGTFPVVVTVTSTGGSTTSATGHALVTDAPLTAGTLTITNGLVGATPANLTFGFTDANPAAPVSDFTATINWGDSTTTAGTVAAAGTGFTVQGSHVYTHTGTFSVTVTVTDVGGSTVTATGHATVASSLLTAGTLTIGNGVEGVTPAPLTFGFTSSNPLAAPADFTATITWGDSATSTGTVTSVVGGGFTAQGSHLYKEEGSYPVSITVTDHAGATVTANGHATVRDASLTATAPALGPSLLGFAGTTATFTDANPFGTVGDFDAKIDWGDGDKSSGLVVRSGSGFAVKGAHVYWHTGYYTIKTKILDDGGSTASASAQVLIYAFPRHGAFVVGDRSATGNVTFWSQQWWKKNSLSGGPAPSSFTGFASDPSCHGHWTAGSDGDAPDDVPDYMAVIVSSSINRSGWKITGDTVRFVIVRTANGGGGSDHWHTGTGTVVGSVPGC